MKTCNSVFGFSLKLSNKVYARPSRVD